MLIEVQIHIWDDATDAKVFRHLGYALVEPQRMEPPYRTVSFRLAPPPEFTAGPIVPSGPLPVDDSFVVETLTLDVRRLVLSNGQETTVLVLQNPAQQPLIDRLPGWRPRPKPPVNEGLQRYMQRRIRTSDPSDD